MLNSSSACHSGLLPKKKHKINHKAFKLQIDEPFILALFGGLRRVREKDILYEIIVILIENMNIKF